MGHRLNILVVGYQGAWDSSLAQVRSFLIESGWWEFAEHIDRGDVTHFDASTHPERGDALDAISAETDMVVALNICGMRGERRTLTLDNSYNRNNADLLPLCRDLGVPLVCVGQFPRAPAVNVPVVLYIEGGEWWVGCEVWDG